MTGVLSTNACNKDEKSNLIFQDLKCRWYSIKEKWADSDLWLMQKWIETNLDWICNIQGRELTFHRLMEKNLSWFHCNDEWWDLARWDDCTQRASDSLFISHFEHQRKIIEKMSESISQQCFTIRPGKVLFCVLLVVAIPFFIIVSEYVCLCSCVQADLMSRSWLSWALKSYKATKVLSLSGSFCSWICSI